LPDVSGKIPPLPNHRAPHSFHAQRFHSAFFSFAHWEKPRFQDRDSKEYISEYDSFLDQFKDAYWALKTGKVTGYQRLFGSAEALQAKATQLGSRLNLEDQQRLKRYLQIRAVELSRSGSLTDLQ
jgi:hypothetical protein